MKPLFSFVTLLLSCFFGYGQSTTVNAVIGDESFLAAFGTAPAAATNEILRLQTHLAYVESSLRSADVSHLNDAQRQRRSKALDLLRTYWQAGRFPRNEAFKGRRPCFIDSDGNICAVGYLIEQTAGRETAEAINQQHQYAYLLDMNEDIVADWAEAYGFSLHECATIQPSYGYIPTDRVVEVPVKSGYGIASGALTGLNAGVGFINFSPRFAGNRGAAYLGLVSGTAQIVMGLANIRKNETEGFINGPSVTYSYKAQNNLSYLNVAAGTATVFTSAFNLWVNTRLRDKRNTVGLFSAPAGGRLAGGLSLMRRL